MACCLFGSSLFTRLEQQTKKVPVPAAVEKRTARAMAVAALAMGGGAIASQIESSGTFLGLILAIASFFSFEAVVGMYFPSIGTLRSRYIPDSHRSVIMNLAGIPLNALVVGVFLFIKFLGVGGALTIATGSLVGAAYCARRLERLVR